jgi:trehalose-6-phosphatase
VGRDKGGAVEAILEAAEPGTPVVYLGDDLTDEAAFCVVNQAMGPHLSVLMRREWRQTAADIWMQPPLELRWFLERWLDATSQKRRVDGSRKHPTAGPAHRHSFPMNGSKSDHDVAEPVHEESRLQD